MNNRVSAVFYKIVFIIFICLLGVYPSNLIAGRVVSDDPLVFAAHIKLGNGSYGSGFYVNDGKYLYLVTAKHVLHKIINNAISNTLIDNNAVIECYSRNVHSKITIYAKLDILDSATHIKRHPVKDIAIIRIASLGGNKILVNNGVKIQNDNNAILTSTPITMLRQYDNVSIGNDIYVFGFPASIGIQDFPQIEYDKPLLKKGILAGKNDKAKTLILDCFIYWGNSGGPVLEVDEETFVSKSFHIIGIVTQYVPLFDRWENVQRQSKLDVSNSGYSVAEPVDDIIYLMQNW